jgi:site-specific DNA-methyltransferase (adenine-specific)
VSAEIIHGDCLAVLREMPAASVDAVITDPPYSSGGAFRGDRMGSTSSKYVNPVEVKNFHPEFTGDNRDQRSYAYWCALWMSECLRIVKPGGLLLVFTDWRQLPTTTDAVQAGGWVWRGIAVWDKTRATRPHTGRFRQQAEYVVWGSAGPMEAQTDDHPEGVFIAAPFHGKLHIAGKPVALMEHLLRVVRPGGMVLDPFAGSASTGVACINSGRSFIGIEREAAYVEIARRRIADAAAQGALFADGAA